MTMIQLVLGTAVGFLLAQAALYGLGRLIAALRRGDLGTRVSALRSIPGPAVLGAFIKYAAPVGIGAALAMLAVWAITDYVAAKSARTAEASLFDSSSAPAESEPVKPRLESAALTPVAPPEPAAGQLSVADPYTDPEFKVQRKLHRAGDPLRETLVQKSEARARNELLREVRQHAQRSQYDCEAAARADRYLKAGLDVWGFANWQVKYFPVDGYRGATLEHCREIKSIVASPVDLRSAVAQRNQDDPEPR